MSSSSSGFEPNLALNDNLLDAARTDQSDGWKWWMVNLGAKYHITRTVIYSNGKDYMLGSALG